MKHAKVIDILLLPESTETLEILVFSTTVTQKHR